MIHRMMSSPTAGVLPKLRIDLKTAMQNKDKTRLLVLRTLLADITNASKTAKPVSSDRELYILLKKKIASASDAVEGFKKANRDDLVQKEEEQLAILKGYIGGIDVVSEEEMRAAVEKTIEEMGPDTKVQPGQIIGKVTQSLQGKVVDNKKLSDVIAEVIKSKKSA